MGWIPSISGDIFLFEPFSQISPIPNLKEFVVEHYERKIDQQYISIIKKYNFCYIKPVQLSDEECDKDEISLFVYLLEKGETHHLLKEILVFQENNKMFELIGQIKIDSIERRGLIRFHLTEFIYNNEVLQKEFIHLVFINIKELYHKHTHHDGDESVADRLLPVCFTSNQDEGLDLILKQFQRKIIFYNQHIKEYFIFKSIWSVFRNPMSDIHEVIRQATGEFLYAKNFINFYHPKESDVFITIFDNEISSIKAFSEEAESQYGLWLTRVMLLLTVVLVALTAILIATSVFFPLRLEDAIKHLADCLCPTKS